MVKPGFPVVVFWLLASLSLGALAGDNLLSSKPSLVGVGLINGNAYLQFSRIEKRRYISGQVDAYVFSPALGVSQSIKDALTECMAGMTDVQMAVITDQWMNNNPKRWHEPMNSIFFNAILIETCNLK